jgi:hypothetical protein
MIPLLVAALLAAQDAPVVVAQGADQPQLAADKDGGFYCVFLRNRNIELSTSTDRGRTWSAPVTAIDAKGKARGGMQRGPRIGVDDRKVITVTAPLSFDGKTTDLWIARSTDGGKTFTPPARVNEQPGTAEEALHAMAVAPTGEAHVAWLDARGREKGQDLYYAKVVDGKVGRNLKVGETLCECCAPGITVDGKGRPIVIWRDGKTSDNRPLWLSASKDGGSSFISLGRVNNTETGVSGCPMDAPAISGFGEGKLAIAWMDMRSGRNQRRVYWTTLVDEASPEKPLAGDSKGFQGHPSIAWDATRVLHAAWEDDRSGVQRIHYRGATGRDLAISPGKGKASYPSLACGKVVGVAYEWKGDAVFTPVTE